MLEQPYSGGSLNGITKEYYEYGKLKSLTPYMNGERNGSGKEFFESGDVKMEVVFKYDKVVSGYTYDKEGLKTKIPASK